MLCPDTTVELNKKVSKRAITLSSPIAGKLHLFAPSREMALRWLELLQAAVPFDHRTHLSLTSGAPQQQYVTDGNAIERGPSAATGSTEEAGDGRDEEFDAVLVATSAQVEQHQRRWTCELCGEENENFRRECPLCGTRRNTAEDGGSPRMIRQLSKRSEDKVGGCVRVCPLVCICVFGVFVVDGTRVTDCAVIGWLAGCPDNCRLQQQLR